MTGDRHAAERERAARERRRLEAEIDRLAGQLEDRKARLERTRADLERLRSDPALRVYLRARRALREIVARLRPSRRPAEEDPAAAGGIRIAALWPAVADRLVGRPAADAVRAAGAAGAGAPAEARRGSSPAGLTIVLFADRPWTGSPGWIDLVRRGLPGAATWIVVAPRSGPSAEAALRAAIERVPEWRVGAAAATLADGLRVAAEADTGPRVLVLDGDVIPASPDWLERLAAGMLRLGAAAGGPRVIVPSQAGPRLASRGIAFAPGPGLPAPIALGLGDDADGTDAEAERVAAVLDGAAILISREALSRLGSIEATNPARLGIELGLRLSELGGHGAYVGAPVVWRTADAGPPLDGTGLVELHDRWGPRLFRAVWRDALSGSSSGWVARRPRLRLARSEPVSPGSDDSLADELTGAGWAVEAVEAVADATAQGSFDVVVALDPDVDLGGVDRSVVRVALVHASEREQWQTRPWFDDLDLVVQRGGGAGPQDPSGPRDRSGAMAGLANAFAAWIARPRAAIHIGPPDWAAAAHWGDTPFARSLQAALGRAGVSASVVVFGERDAPIAVRADIAIHVVGTRRLPVRSGQVNVLWIISHPDAVRADVVEGYDLAFAASDGFADHLAAQVSIPVGALHQATDPGRFRPADAGDSGPLHDLLFVGNSRNRHRPVLDALADTEHDLAVYGGNWRPDLLDPRFLRGDWIANEDLHAYYSAAGIVLNDHWADMRDEGFISNRVYDALASGGFVVSDAVPGLDEEFDGAVATWTDAASLDATIEHFLAHPDERRQMAERGRAAVLARHTFDHRVTELLRALAPLLAERGRESTSPLPSGHNGETMRTPNDAAAS